MISNLIVVESNLKDSDTIQRFIKGRLNLLTVLIATLEVNVSSKVIAHIRFTSISQCDFIVTGVEITDSLSRFVWNKENESNLVIRK